jgi:isopentenyl phosphate kinase
LVEVWDKSKPISGNHDKNQDVTGGIFLKLQSASMICDLVPNVWFIDGREPGRVLELLETGTTRGTQIVS